MKKQTKGAIAVAAAGALLLGGAGSYAVWSDSADIAGGTITSGVLDLGDCDATTDGWTSLNPPIKTIADIETYRIVPTETVEFQCEVPVSAIGDRLSAGIEADKASITGSLVTAKAVQLSTTLTDESGAEIDTITQDHNNQTIGVSVLVSFDADNTDHQLGDVDLGNLKLVVTQTALTAA